MINSPCARLIILMIALRQAWGGGGASPPISTTPRIAQVVMIGGIGSEWAPPACDAQAVPAARTQPRACPEAPEGAAVPHGWRSGRHGYLARQRQHEPDLRRIVGSGILAWVLPNGDLENERAIPALRCRVRSNVEFIVSEGGRATRPVETQPRLTVFQAEAGRSYTLRPAVK